MLSHQHGSTQYRFGPYLLIPQRQLLLRNDIPVRIGGRSFDILTLLVRRAGEDVSKQELLTFCWPNTHVQESNLKVNIAALRRQLATSDGNRYIATASTSGYRFTAAVSIEQPDGGQERSASISRPIRPSTELIGRETEIQLLTKRLTEFRCVTIAGPGGMGKTTVALALADHVRGKYRDGLEFVDLSSVGDPEYAPSAIAAGVAARQQSNDPLAEIVTVLTGRETLLVLDNCEHLLSSISPIATRLLEALPALTVLATSREPLSITEEHVHRLDSLSVPQPHQSLTAAEVRKFSAVHLFMTRASGNTNFVLDEADAPIVSSICRRLDGIPLAIELAASKTFAYGIRTLNTMLEQKLVFLKNSVRTAPSRQQTMLATLDWSYQLLSGDEAALLRVISTFSGKFQVDDATAVAELVNLDTNGTIDGLGRLTSKSLVYAEHHRGYIFYRLLESTRAYANERLRETDEHDAVFLRYGHRILQLFERASAEADVREKSEWISEYASRVDDARAVINWAFGSGGETLLGIKLTAAIIPVWYEMSALNEMRNKVELALGLSRKMPDCPPDLIMKLVGALASTSAFSQQLPQNTEAHWRECYNLGIQTKSKKYEIMGLWGLCAHLLYTGRTMEAFVRLEECVSIAEKHSDAAALDEAHRMMATAQIYLGRIAEARDRLEQLNTQYRSANGQPQFVRFHSERGAGVRCTLALALFVLGEPERAMLSVRAAIKRATASGHVITLGNALAVFAVPIAFWAGDYDAVDKFLDAAEESGRMDNTAAWREVCHFFRSALDAKRGAVGALEDLQERLCRIMSAGQVLRAPMYHAMVAEALLEGGRGDESQAWADRALQLAIAHDANWCMPEIFRIKGLIELEGGTFERAEATFGEAIHVAAQMGARTFEIRASVSLARHLLATDRLNEARTILRSSLNKFANTDRFADLTRARQLLDLIETDAPDSVAS